VKDSGEPISPYNEMFSFSFLAPNMRKIGELNNN
jgi:hypothetical protein